MCNVTAADIAGHLCSQTYSCSYQLDRTEGTLQIKQVKPLAG